MTLLKLLLLLTAFVTPLLGATGNFGYEQIKVLFFMVFTGLMGFIWLLTKQKIKWDLIRIASLAFILVLFITSAFGSDIGSSLFGREPYFQGLILYAYLFLFSLLVSALAIKLEYAAMILAGSATIVSLLAIQDWVLLNLFHQQIPAYAGRVVSTFGQPNFYAGFILLVLPFANQLGRWKYLVLAAGTLAILASGSRAAVLLLPLVFLALMAEKIKNRLLIGGTAVIILAVFGVSLYLSFDYSTGILRQEIFDPFTSTLKAQANPADTVEKRFFIWPLVWELISQKPFTGYGLENIDLSWSDYFIENKHAFFEENLRPSSVLIRLKDLTIDRTHSYALDLLMFSGIFGFLAWGFLVCLLIRQARSRAVFTSLLIYLVWVQFQNQSIVHLIYFWLLAGLIDSEVDA